MVQDILPKHKKSFLNLFRQTLMTTIEQSDI